jgi:N-acetylglucosaminyldiphosphoundecaprenol N-acetyl-beta-D-mannosaminyltransferase
MSAPALDVEATQINRPGRVDLMGMLVDPVSEDEAVGHVLDALDSGRGGTIVTPNLDHLRQFAADAEVRRVYSAADLVVADGMPVVWACRLQGTPLPGRVAGSDLILSLSQAAAGRGRSVFLLGGNPGAAEAAAVELMRRSPGLEIAGTMCPPMEFEKSPLELMRVRRALIDAQPDVVFVGVGFPRSAQIAELLRPDLPNTWFAGVGISLSFVAGEISRAPKALQGMGLEWVHRLVQEPARLFRRYILHDLPFVGRVAVHSLRRRLRGGAYGPLTTRRPTQI